MSWHDAVHWLDLLRHELISTLGWEPVKSNIGAGVWWAILVALVATLLWPPLREAIKRFAQRHVDAIKGHVTAEHKKLHAKLDRHEALLHHVILHSKDIPPFEPAGKAAPAKRPAAKRIIRKAKP
jgi:hypothetical protein